MTNTKDELFKWAAENKKIYPALKTLREEKIDITTFLYLPGQRGAYRGLYICFIKNTNAIDFLRRQGFAVAEIDGYDYEMARLMILECAKFIKKFKAKQKIMKLRNKKNKNKDYQFCE